MSASIEMDGTDHRILAHLRRDGRATLAEIGHLVGLSAPAVKRRMEKLEEARIITGYTVVVDELKLGGRIEAFVELRFAGNTKVADISGVAQGLAEVVAVFTTAGDPDALVHLRVRDMNHLTQVIDRLRRHRGVNGTKTLMVLDSWMPGGEAG